MSSDLILLNGKIRTMDSAHPDATAIIMRDSRIEYLGDDAGARRKKREACEIIDLNGRLVLPGFTDSHIHFCGFAQSIDRVNLAGCKSVDEAVARVASRVATARQGEVILGHSWNHSDWIVPTMPDKHSLDRVAPDKPVVLTRKDGHSAWVNSAALDRWRVKRETPDPPGGRIERDSNQEPSGLLRENAMTLVGNGIGSDKDEVPESALLQAVRLAHAAGVTGIHDIEGTNALLSFQALNSRGKLRLRVSYCLPKDNLEHAVALGIRRGFGDDCLRVRAVKLFADGSLGSKTAEVSEPFIGSPDNHGMPLTPTSEMLQLARAAVRGGLDVWIHAIGDAAISRTLGVFETIRREGYRDPILRVEHVQHICRDDIPRFSQANVIASMQPIHLPSDKKVADELLGPERARYTYAFRSLLDSGARLAFGSDCPVESLEPIRGIHAAVTRQDSDGEPADGWYPEERISVEEAVRGFTLGAAYAVGESEMAGTLTVGKRADAVILSQDIFSIDPRDIRGTVVDYTIVGGRVVYDRLAAS